MIMMDVFGNMKKHFSIMNDQSFIQDLKSFVMISWCDMFSMSINKCDTALFGQAELMV